MPAEAITMTMRQLDPLKAAIQALADAYLKSGIGASRLGLTPRQTLRLLRRYQQDGAAGLVNRHQGQLANWRTTGHRRALRRGRSA